MDPKLVRVSKSLSLVLRHDPGAIGITLDPNGWVEVDELLSAWLTASVPPEYLEIPGQPT